MDENKLPKTLEEAIFWLEVAGYEITNKVIGRIQLKSPNGDYFWTSNDRVKEAGRSCWREYHGKQF